jgi:hypothetical protein
VFEILEIKVKEFDAIDIWLVRSAVIVGIVIIAKILLSLLDINYLILFLVLAALAARPVYKFWQ